MRQILFLCLLFTTLAQAKIPNAGQGLDAIYGADERELVSKQSSKIIKNIARSVALILSEDQVEIGFLRTSINASRMQETLQMCTDERFVDLPAFSGCTGFLIAEDLMATAGHCFFTKEDCTTKKIVFDVDSKKQTATGYRVSNSNVYSCKEIVVQELNGNSDFAIIRLDRATKNRQALKLNLKTKIDDGSSVFMIGHPFGLPLMHSKDAKISENNEPLLFKVGLDSFHGNSGSPVINSKTLEVEGILVNGQEDLVLDSNQECYRNKSYDGHGAEGVFRIIGLAPFLP